MKKINYFIIVILFILIFLKSCSYPYSDANPTKHKKDKDDQNDNTFIEEIKAPYLAIINGLNETLSFIYKHGDDIIESNIKTGQSPNQIIKKGNKVFIINSLSNSVIKYDFKSFAIKDEFSTGTGTNPYKGVINQEKLYITAYLTHKLLSYDLDGNNAGSTSLEILNEDGKTYYPFPQGIAQWNSYIFIACMYSEENGATKTRDPGRVAVYSTSSNNITGYIEAGARDTNNVIVNNDILYIISSGSYNSGFQEDGKIETVALTNVNLENPAGISPITQANNSSFGSFCIYNNMVWTGNLGNGTLRYYNTTTSPWTQEASRSFPGGHGMAYIPDIKYTASKNELYVTEFNGNKLYILNPSNLSIKKEYKCSSNKYGDAQFMLLAE